MSKLLVFAHHGEAQSFISHFKLKPIDRTTYRNDELHLLICGEGKENALFHTTKYLAQNNIDSVYNFGVVASLRENIQSLQVFEVRTIYSHNGVKPQFHSFTTNANSTIDCVSSESRVLTKEQKLPFIPMAELLDREAWAIAMSAKNFNKEFYCFKVVSDELEEHDFCHTVKEQAEIYSTKLLNAFIKHYKEIKITFEQEESLELPSYFYFTRSMQEKFTKLLTKYAKLINRDNQEALNCIDIESFNLEGIPKKQRALNLIKYLELQTNPLMAKVEEELSRKLKVLKDQKIQTHFKDNFESEKLSISVDIKNNNHLERIISSLQSINYQDIVKTARGEIDV